jgi:hypothetical protein
MRVWRIPRIESMIIRKYSTRVGNSLTQTRDGRVVFLKNTGLLLELCESFITKPHA